MKAVAIVDTSIFCNFLNIPHMNSSRRQVVDEFMHAYRGRYIISVANGCCLRNGQPYRSIV
jgi:hypothetical protein